MADKIGTIYAELEARTGKFNTDIDKATRKTEQSADKIGKSFQQMTKSLMGIGAVVVAVKKLISVMKELENNAREQERSIRKITGQIQATGMASERTAGQLVNLAGKLQDISNFSDTEILDGVVSQLLKFQSVTGDVLESATTQILNMAAVTGSLEGAAQAVGIALEAPVEGINRLRRQGIIFTEAQKEQINNFVETNRLADAQAVILEKLEGTFGGMAEKMAEPTIQLKNAWGDLQDELGYGLMRAANNMSTSLIPVIQEATSFFQALNYEVRLTKEEVEMLSVEQIRAEIELLEIQLEALRRSKAWINELTAAWNVMLGTLGKIAQILYTFHTKYSLQALVTRARGGEVGGWTDMLSGAHAKRSKIEKDISELKVAEMRAELEGRTGAKGSSELAKSAIEITEAVEETIVTLVDLKNTIKEVVDEELEYAKIGLEVIDNVEKAWADYFGMLSELYGKDSREWKLALDQKADDLAKFVEGKVAFGDIEPALSYQEVIQGLEDVIAKEKEYAVIGIESAEVIKDAYDKMLTATAVKYGENSREYKLMLFEITEATKRQSEIISNLLSGIGVSLTYGISNAIFETITNVNSLEEAFKSLGRTIVAEIGKIAIRMAVLSTLRGITTAIAPGLSLPMFGANKGGVVAQPLSTGGVVGIGSFVDRDSVLTNLTRGEFVVNRQAATANLPLLESINSGRANILTAKLDRIAEILVAKDFAPSVNVVNRISPTDINKANNIGKQLRGGF